MSREPINSWVDKAKTSNAAASETESKKTVNVVRREPQMSKGAMIMEVADKLWPGLMELLRGVRDNSGMLLQPAHVRGIALNMAQDLVNDPQNYS